MREGLSIFLENLNISVIKVKWRIAPLNILLMNKRRIMYVMAHHVACSMNHTSSFNFVTSTICCKLISISTMLTSGLECFRAK